MQKILFPTDFSVPAQNALLYTINLAKELNATIDILHVSGIVFLPRSDKDTEQLVDENTQEIQAKINNLVSFNSKNLIGKRKVVYGGFTAAEIADEAEEGNYDLIVMGMKGEHGRIDKWMGSVTTNLMIKAPCPVLAIPEKAVYQGIKKIALATVLPSSNNLPIQQVSAFAKALSSTLEFVTVDNIVRKAKEYQVGQEKTNFFGIDYTVITNPSIINGINDFVSKSKPDVLSLYMRKRTLLERLFHFSTSTEMAFHTMIPLFVFHK